MQIALCDDEKAFHETIKLLISQYKQINPDRSLSLSSFSSGKALLNHVDEYGGFDLYILDCIMPEMNGIELGTALRKRDDAGILLYLTTSPDFALDSYRVDAFDYLLKPVDKNLFFQSLDKAYRSFSQIMQEVVSVKTADSIRMIPVADIRYAERIEKQIYYYITDNTVISSVTFNSSFQNAAADLLSHKGMLLVGSSYVVNLYHVTEVTKSDLILTGNLHVPVPRRMYEAVKKEWASFWLNGGRYHAF
ncbi:MAG: LytTR family DNA-binding domain-containing protein [Eubacteriales bacterium]|nr:LytTR family DNA-binding domain-containing protein [Eubacteriales bacterium]